MNEEYRCEWEGSRILRKTIIPSKRRVLGSEDSLIPTDLREWISPCESNEIKSVIGSLGLPHHKKKGSFDKRARLVWEYVIDSVNYREDCASQRAADFWQFPAETLALGSGDCEDCTFLLATLLLSAGISPFCVRVIFGILVETDGSRREHCWPIYKDEKGAWRILESTLDRPERDWPLADKLARIDSSPRYHPDICLNQHHVWVIGRRRIKDAAAYLEIQQNKK